MPNESRDGRRRRGLGLVLLALALNACTARPDDQGAPPLDGLLESQHPGPPESNSAVPWSIHIEDDRLMAIAPTAAEFSIGEVLEVSADKVRLGPDPNCEAGSDGRGRDLHLARGGRVRFLRAGR